MICAATAPEDDRRADEFLVAAIFLLLALNGCAFWNQIDKSPSAVYEGFQIENASMLQADFDFKFIFTNPNPIGLQAGKISYDIQLNGRHFARGRLDESLELPAGGSASMGIPIAIRYLDVYDSMAEMIQAKQAAFRIIGRAHIGPVRIPIQAGGIFYLPQLPVISLQAIDIQPGPVGGATLVCVMKIDNPNAFDLNFKNLNIKMQLNTLQLARLSLQPTGPVPRDGSLLIESQVDLSLTQIGPWVYEILKRPESRYRIDGHMQFDSPTGATEVAPFRISGPIPFKR
jgi:LEA14-like dessication related protein